MLIVPHPVIGCRIPSDHLPPLGLLAIGGPLIDNGYLVELVDAKFGPMPLPDLVTAIVSKSTDAATIDLIRKEATTNIDREAIRLLRANGILSIPI